VYRWNERRRRTNRYQINLWSLPGPGPRPDICLSGSCRRDICPKDIYRPAQPPAEAEAAGGRQQLLFPRRLKKQRQGSRISTSTSPTVNRGSLKFQASDNPAHATAATSRHGNWRSRRSFFARCCENGTEFEAFGSRSLCSSTNPRSIGTYFRVPTGRRGQSSPYTRDSCRQRSPTSFALLSRHGQSTKPRNRPGPQNRRSNWGAATPGR
jgi:hypothetical protein